MTKLSRVFTGAALEDGSRQLCIKVENPDGSNFIICSGVYLQPDYLIDGVINFFRKRTSSSEELKFVTDKRDAFEQQYNRVENIVRVSEGHVATITLDWVLSIISMDDRGELKKKGSWITLKSILQAAGQTSDVDCKILGSRKLYDYFKQYYLANDLQRSSVERYTALARLLMREELYHQIVLGDSSYTLDIDAVSQTTIEDIREYCLNEGGLSKQYSDQYVMITKLVDLAIPVKKPRRLLSKKPNEVISVMLMLKKVFKYLRFEVRETINDPFSNYEIGVREYNPFPIYFSTHELSQIRKVDLSDEPLLAVQRDVLLFHCLTGCRYRDMIKLSDINVQDDEIVYEPELNVKENIPAEPVIKLVKEAISLIEQYEGVDSRFRLFPFISKVYYEDCCRKILEKANIKRIIFVHDSKQRKQVGKSLCEVFDANVPVMTYRILNNKEERSQDDSKSLVESSQLNVKSSYRGIDDDVLKAAISLIE